MPAKRLIIVAVWWACVVGFAGALAAADAGNMTINMPLATVERRTFDPADPPPEMPALSAEEAAVANSAFGVQSSLEAVVLHERSQGGQTISTLKIEAIHMDLSLTVTIWLPQDAPRELVAHEEGHRRISEMYYQDAERIARELAQTYIGRSTTARGADAEAARQAAMNRVINELNGAYMAATQMPSSRVNAIFDKVTNHGRNGKVTVEQAIRQAVQQYEQEQQHAKRPETRTAKPQPPQGTRK